MRYLVVVAMIFLSVFLTGFADTEIPTEIEKVNLKLDDDELAITFLDLSSGEATLINHVDGGNILINAGGPGTKEELENLLNMYNITNLKSIIITKEDAQYQSNLDWLIKKYSPSELIIGNLFTEVINSKTIPKVIKWKQTDKHELLPGMKVEVIQQGISHDGIMGMDLLFEFGSHHILYMTTSNKNVETSLIARKDLSKVNIIKVADFARDGGSSQDFIEHIDPQVAIIFQMKGKNPSLDVMERLRETWIDTYSTKQFGNITIKCNQNEYDVITISIESSQIVK
ncbi:hypothetical protein PY093_05955 [Cytobacillus sp. S13-E01]|uniref:ComEC/Rec2 family competence protein n=1 Tax=Cytobacillus sp. S13-E01 TaxID=3031326 RepID=UPI0023D87C1B|nr:hypothetical protein [Cytobacillus sp. S13-E01]MDF0726258.1 hypothetical protein [Cytobacillus sp. S13-E01]